MHAKTTLTAVAILTFLCPGKSTAVDLGTSSLDPASFLANRDFSWNSLANPENLFYPAYFWLWNGSTDPTLLRAQLDDMYAHDARSVCMLPEPYAFRPTSMNNQLDVAYLSADYFNRVQVAVQKAASLGMNWWLYDEGGWPSGQACGQVLQTRPASALQRMVLNGNGSWSLSTGGGVDLLDPQTTSTFIALTHQKYYNAVGSYFGNTIKMTFTDEPAYATVSPGSSVPWCPNADTLFNARFGYSLQANLSAFAVTNPSLLTTAQKQVRVDAFDFWSGQFDNAYFQPLNDWARQKGLASGGHLGGEDVTFGAVTYGYGSVMRQLRAMDVPGVDAIWRQIFPGQTNGDFPKFASSAAHYNGTSLVMSESFCVYGNGLTPAQAKWVTDYERVRGVTLQVNGDYPSSTQDHLMEGERPHFGPVDPLWQFQTALNRYTARVDQVLASGTPAIDTALYYPVRDMWANGNSSDPAVTGFDMLTHSLTQRQTDYDVIDDDVLNDPTTQVVGGRLKIGAMSYRTIVVGPNQWISSTANQVLNSFQAAGGQVIRISDPSQINSAIAPITPTVKLNPASPGISVVERRWNGGGATFLFNEGNSAYAGNVKVDVAGTLYEIDPATGLTRSLAYNTLPDGSRVIPLSLAAGQSMLVIGQPAADVPANLAPTAAHKIVQSVILAGDWTGRIDSRSTIGTHNYQVTETPNAPFRPVTLGEWAPLADIGEDFSGLMTYRRTVAVPESMRNGRLMLDLGSAEYAARVWMDGVQVGDLLASPWTIELPSLNGRTSFQLDIQVANTLANQLTSQEVMDAWNSMSGAGWPSGYNAQAWLFEADSRGGGLLGPVRLNLVVGDPPMGGTTIPEPGTLALLATGLLGLCAYAWRKQK
jgi:hypothetical protein